MTGDAARGSATAPMTDQDVRAVLREPIALGPVTVPGRVVSTSHQTSLVADHLPTDDLVAYHAARAQGGTPMIVLEATAVHPTGLLTDHTLCGYRPEIAERYRALVAATAPHGARLFVQLFHGGREQFGASPRAPAVAPSAIPSPRFHSEPRALTARELAEIVDGYATATRLAREGGLAGVELSFSHGYLVAQFLAAASNTRRDGWGESADGRLRLAREVLTAVRDAAGDELAVGIRLSADELAPGLLDAEACARIGAALCETAPVDFVSAVLGNSATYRASTWIAPPPPVAANAVAGHLARLRAAVAPVPVIASTRVVDLAGAADLVASGAADLVGMTRALIADPELLVKTDEPIVACIGCNQGCIGHYHQGVPIACTVNPRTGRERTLPAPPRGRPARRSDGRRVVVIGGGPAGVAAATTAARAGDTVVLRERSDRLGGQLALGGAALAHREVHARWHASVIAELAHAGVEVELGRAVTAAAEVADVDLVIVATGARPHRPRVAAVEVPVIDAWAAIETPDVVAGPVLVADWGGEWSGLDAAERLAAAGREVTLACAATHPGATLHQYQRNLYLARLDELGVTILHHTELDPATGALRHVFSGREVAWPAGATLVVAHGREPEDALWADLEDHPGAVRAGDVLSPRTLEEAVLEGTRAALR